MGFYSAYDTYFTLYNFFIKIIMRQSIMISPGIFECHEILKPGYLKEPVCGECGPCQRGQYIVPGAIIDFSAIICALPIPP